jgi:AcrR family transcriptional regulator
MDLAALPARERILLTAHDLFYRDGIRATGIDRIIAESGVAKLTFYRHFSSKDSLIQAFLEYRHEQWMAWFVDALGRAGARSGMGLAPVATAMAEWFEGPQFRGCAFINAVAEVAGSFPQTVEMAGRHKREMAEVLAGLLASGSPRQAIAEAAAVAVDGAIVTAQVNGAATALRALRRLLKALESSA